MYVVHISDPECFVRTSYRSELRFSGILQKQLTIVQHSEALCEVFSDQLARLEISILICIVHARRGSDLFNQP
jgi:hypothetical protein